MVETCYTVPACPVSIALVTDTHNRPADAVLESLRQREPALILLAGDFVYADPPSVPGRLKMQNSPEARDLLRGCAALAPTFVSLGNHEWMLNEADLALISSYGVTVLDNRFVSVNIGGTEICCGGLSSARLTAYQTWRQAQPVSFLYPEPRYLKNRRIDLILSGHAHGGQWRYYSPLRREWRGVYAPGQGLLPKLTGGVHGNLIISRGLSNNAPIPRLNNPPELVYLRGI